MRRSLARCAIAFTSASVGRPNVSRSVSRTQLLASRSVGLRSGCPAHVGLLIAKNAQNKKGEAGFPPPLGALFDSAVQQDPADSNVSPSIRPPPSSEPPIRKCGHWLLQEFDMTFDLGKESMVGAHADIKAGMPGVPR